MTFKNIRESIGKAIDLRDVFVFGGLGTLGYGLYQYQPWIAYVVCGTALMAIGLFFGRGK